jgi:hypothetical protein
MEVRVKLFGSKVSFLFTSRDYNLQHQTTKEGKQEVKSYLDRLCSFSVCDNSSCVNITTSGGLRAVLPGTNHSEPINIDHIHPSTSLQVGFKTFNSTLHPLRHEQPHDGISEAFDDARGPQPPSCSALDVPPPVHARRDPGRRLLDDRPSIRHALGASTAGLPSAQAREVGRWEGVLAG